MANWQMSICGCFYLKSNPGSSPQKKALPLVDLSSHTTILSAISRTVLTQTFLNTSKTDKLDQVKYVFPLYDGVSVVGFKCTVAGSVIVGEVKEKQQAREDYKEAVDRGETAGLLEQFPEASDCFQTRIGNVPVGKTVKVEITYLGELKYDAETDGVRFTIPTVIAPRYGFLPGETEKIDERVFSATDKEGIRILVDIAVEDEVTIRGVQSPSHPIAMTMGRTSSMPEEAFDNQHASATLTLGSTILEKDFIVVVTSKGHDIPRAILEAHPTLPNHRALLATLVPKFSLPPIHPEIVFVADRSGSMSGKIPVLVSALKIFLKSLPVGVKFNICSFGTIHHFLWPKSKTYDESSLSTALTHIETFDANFGGTEMLAPIEDTINHRYRDMPLEVIVVTDGETWKQEELFNFINKAATESVRFFSLGIGHGASSSLVEGIARAGDGFAQFVGDNEKMEKKVVKVLKGALTPHITDYTMEVKYETADEEYEMVESATESLKSLHTDLEKPGSKIVNKVISLFDKSAKMDDTIDNSAGKYDHLPEISTPKILQTPHKIPSLYSFNRTSVYLLMSADSCQRTPKAVVVRATSQHGPLELEIPVQDIGVGDTLHRLAARKATQELEEGRGWIVEAKDNHGQQLKTKFEGRWDEMVEREAVRLGVQYQIENKWCSFVAVDRTAKSTEGLPSNGNVKDESFKQYSTRSKPLAKPTQSANFTYFSALAGGGPPVAACSPSMANRMSSTGLMEPTRMRSVQRDVFANTTSLPAPPGASPSTPYDLRRGVTNNGSVHQHHSNHSRRMGCFNASPVSMQQPRADPRRTREREASSSFPSPKRSRLPDIALAHDNPGYFNQDDYMGAGLFASHTTTTPTFGSQAATSAPTNENKMHELISLQAFDGSWDWSERLVAVLEIDQKWVRDMLVDFDEKVMATLLAVGFLEGKMLAEVELWEMVVEKAKAWLRRKVEEGKYVDGLAKVKKEAFGMA